LFLVTEGDYNGLACFDLVLTVIYGLSGFDLLTAVREVLVVSRF